MRSDGKKVKNVDPMYRLIPFVLDKRNDAMNMVTIDIPYAPMQKYINEKRKEGISISHMGLVIASLVRTTAEFPAINRFVVNKRLYYHNDFTVGMVVMRPKGEDGSMSKMHFELTDDIFQVQKTIDEYVALNRNPDSNGLDKLMDILLAIPGMASFAVGFLKALDIFGLLPKSVIEASPFHSSMDITNLASIRTNHIFHHIYNFGTTGIFVSMGNTREVPHTDINGNIYLEKCIPMGIVMDERIAPGGYFGQVFQRIKQYLKDPTLLEGAPKVVNKDA